ncbi:hypothetical protein DFP72DRAFT_1141457 [Ephemerocybe angulata]|uniref:Uncharacterized protein n=1 Tax=Ephemerocybe angulata TaxID=980116 RepID=A0A8H6HMM2_9AGAR|nr:hypothetical protein DFP72DRAFT_1141457 [Tulosesus angulatus]
MCARDRRTPAAILALTPIYSLSLPSAVLNYVLGIFYAAVLTRSEVLTKVRVIERVPSKSLIEPYKEAWNPCGTGARALPFCRLSGQFKPFPKFPAIFANPAKSGPPCGENVASVQLERLDTHALPRAAIGSDDNEARSLGTDGRPFHKRNNMVKSMLVMVSKIHQLRSTGGPRSFCHPHPNAPLLLKMRLRWNLVAVDARHSILIARSLDMVQRSSRTAAVIDLEYQRLPTIKPEFTLISEAEAGIR